MANVDGNGTSLYFLSNVAERFGFEANGYRGEWGILRKIDQPSIAHYGGDHFIVLTKITDREVRFIDPAYGEDSLPKELFLEKWTGVVLSVVPKENSSPDKDVEELIRQAQISKRETMKKFFLLPLRHLKAYLLRIILLTGLIQASGIVIPLISQTIIDNVLVGQNLSLLKALIIGLLFIYTTQVFLGYLRSMFLIQAKVEYESNFLDQFFNQIIYTTQSNFDKYKREDFINRFQEVSNLRQVFNPSVLQAFLDIFLIIGYVTTLFFYHTSLALVAIGSVSCLVIITVVFTPRLRNMENKIFFQVMRSTGEFIDTLLGVQTVKLLRIENLRIKEWRNSYAKSMNTVLKTEAAQQNLQIGLSLFSIGGRVLIYWLGANLTTQGVLSIGQYVAFITIYTIIVDRTQAVSSIWFLVVNLSILIDRTSDILSQETEGSTVSDHNFDAELASVSFENVRFRYQNGQPAYALSEVSFEIPFGLNVTVVGRNGSGKTTLGKLLVGFYPEYEGKILIGGSELRTLSPQGLRKRITMLSQDNYLFRGTIRKNILYGNPGSSMSQLAGAVKLADLNDFIHGHLLGYNLLVSDGGGNLSRGQKVKIGFARLFISDPDVIILDESTSGLDVESERIITRNIIQHFSKKTIIRITHKLIEVHEADLVIFMDNGRVVATGKHQDLLHQSELYRNFYASVETH